MKVCFYFDNKRRSDIDYSNPENGNPGIGGTEYMIWTISYYLSKFYDDIDVYLLSPVTEKLSNKTINIKCDNICESIKISNELGCDVLVVRNRAFDRMVYELIDDLKVKTIIWSHNFEKYDELKYATRCKYIRKNVCVSKEQYDRLRDHDIYKKSTYIYNALDFKNYIVDEIDASKKENILCYVGAIKPTKSFHIVAKNWDKVTKKVPDAKLYVIGGGNLYDKAAKLGPYSIAEEGYERQFIDYIIDKNGNIKNNIKFLGVLGESKKLEVMSKAKVGIVNPIAKDETFCISAIEFGALGIPVVGKKRYGLLNTVDNNKSGILFKTEQEMVNSIVLLLKNSEQCTEKGNYAKTYARERFNIITICSEWKRLLELVSGNIEDEDNDKDNEETVNYICDSKWLREINRRIKYLPIFNKLPAILEYPECIYDNSIYLYLSNIKNKILGKSIRGD